MGKFGRADRADPRPACRRASRCPGAGTPPARSSAAASKIGARADGLDATVRRFNDFATTGKDADFGRGDSA